MANNPLSSLSYTNKDFNSIYVELLDIVKELSSKWDPTISNESDPGVILLKADAIIADKNNYNIDKNILEMYPETVTQEFNARNLYKQLAYRMPWYQSATMSLTFRWIGKDLNDGEAVEIPKYTMVTNEDGSVVYTLTEEVFLDADHQVATCNAIEGTFQTLSINGSDIINLGNLDSNNRIYLPESTVAENGLFIKTVDGLQLWERVDNLQVHPKDSTLYEFGIDGRNSVCYIEFPEDIDKLIGSGIQIQYVISQGAEGNVAATAIDRFYTDLSIRLGNESVVLNNDVISLYNPSASTNGKDPQSLTEAYRSYRKTAGTFDTLVTLRDYINSIYNSGLVSNAVVSDRLSDIQCAYTIRTEDTINPFVTQISRMKSNTISYYKAKVDSTEDGWFIYDSTSSTMESASSDVVKSAQEKNSYLYRLATDNNSVDMTAFDLKLYLLHNPGIINSNDAYESSFNLEPYDSAVTTQVKTYVYDQQCIQHDFIDILENLPCLFKNSYPIGIKIVPQHFLTSVQIDQVKRNIIAALWDVCNANAIDFGTAPDYDIIYDAISNADERIKIIILDEFDYTTFATYWDSSANEGVGGFKDIPVSNSNSKFIIECDNEEELSKYKEKFTPDWTKVSLLKSYFICKDNNQVYRYNDNEGDFEVYSTLRKDIQTQIIAKSILAGRTPLVKDDSRFTYAVNHKYVDEFDTDRITTALVVSPFSDANSEWTSDTFTNNNQDVTIAIPTINDKAMTGEYKLQKNESVRFLAPSFDSVMSYSNYVKFQLVLKESTGTTRNAVHWSESVKNDTVYQVDSSDYNNTVFEYISKDIVIPVPCSVDSNNTYYHLYLDKCQRYLTGDGNTVRADPCPINHSTNNAVWSIIYDDVNKYYLLHNVGLDKYLTVKAISISNFSTEEQSSDESEPNKYTHKVTSTEKKYELVLEDRIVDYESIVIDYPQDTNNELTGVCNYIHLCQKWDYTHLTLVDFNWYNTVTNSVTKDSFYALNAKVNTNFIVDQTSTSKKPSLPEAPVSNVVTFTFTENTTDIKDVDDVYHLDFTKLYIRTDSTEVGTAPSYIAKQTITGVETASDSSNSMNGLYSGTSKWLTVRYQKDRILIEGNDYRDNIEYTGTDAVIHQAWKSDTILLYEEEVLYRIPANCDYQLQPGDSITFFWHTDDSIDDSPYEYKKYTGIDSTTASATEQSPIIRPSFVINGHSKDDSGIVNPDLLNESGIIEHGDKAYTTVYGMYGDNDLSGSKSIEIRNINQTVLDRGKHEYYFITNSIKDNGSSSVYTMTLNSSQSESDINPTEQSTAVGLYNYILQADEYFVVTNKTYTEYLILNPGTLIGLEITWTKDKLDAYVKDNVYSQYTLTVPMVPYSEISTIGIDAFSKYCQRIPAEHKLYTQEQQVHNVIEGNILMVKRLKDTSVFPPIVSWKDSSISSDFEVSYKTVSGEVVNLPSISLQSSKYSWSARSYLNLNTSTDDPQVIKPVDSVNKKASRMIVVPRGENTNDVFPVFKINEGQVDNSNLDDIHIQSDVFVNKVGGPNIDISYVNLFADRESPVLYIYNIDKSFSDEQSNWRIRSEDGKIVLYPKTSGASHTFTLNLKPNSSYMLPVQLVSKNNISIELKIGTTDVKTFNTYMNTETCRNYYKFNTSDDSQITLTLVAKGDITDNDIIVFDNVIRYTSNELFFDKYGITDADIITMMQSLDFENIYDYSYIVNADNEYYIEDPLSGKSFFDKHHVMNAYTIGKAELQQGNSSDAYIMITNNR